MGKILLKHSSTKNNEKTRVSFLRFVEAVTTACARYSEVVNRANEIYGAADVMKARAVNRAA